ncbi:MAG: C25 family cysteine peptidase, partial [Anaerolineae bacterium]
MRRVVSRVWVAIAVLGAVMLLLFLLSALFHVSSVAQGELDLIAPDINLEPLMLTAEHRADAYEEDDVCILATEIPTSSFYQYHTFHDHGDADWVGFDAVVGQTYTLRAQAIGASADLVLELYAACDSLSMLSTRGVAASDADLTFNAPASGMYYLRATNQNPAVYGDNTDYKLSVQQQMNGAVVIVAVEAAALQDHIDYCTNNAYNVFRHGLGFSGDDIYYLNPGSQDADGDSVNDVDATPTITNVIAALSSWAQARVNADTPFYLYAMGGGQVDSIPLGTGNGALSAQELDTRLSDLETATGLQDINVILDASYAGSFIDGADEISNPGRAIIASTGRDKHAYASALGSYFSDSFWVTMQNDGNLWMAFQDALAAVEETGHDQTPWLDDDGDAIPNETTDGALAIQRPPHIAPDQIRTLILVNENKVQALYGETATNQLLGQLNELRLEDRVRGVVIPVETDAVVAAAYDDWDANLLETSYANAVTDAIHQLILDQLQTYPNVEYLVLVGDDRVIPFRRVLDQTSVPEHNYSAVSISTTVGAALADDMTLTDNFYADPEFSTWDAHDLYIPDLSLGRLVETPAEIEGQIEQFLAVGRRTVDHALVTGREFAQDGASSICAMLGVNEITTDCGLIGNSWTITDFRSSLFTATHDLISLNQTGNHYRYGPPVGEPLSSQEMLSDSTDMRGVVVYGLVCHVGLNVPPENPVEPLDWPQVFAAKRIVSIASTGYTWGGGGVVYGESMMRGLTQHLVSSSSIAVGQALVEAKQDYFEQYGGSFDYYHEKTLLEFNLYGLPMHVVQKPSGSPLLAISKTGPATVAANAPITYTLTVINSGGAEATGLVITDTIPSGAYYVSGGTKVGGVVSWTVDNLGEGLSTTVQFVVTATVSSITNSDYIVRAAGGYSATGSVVVVTAISTGAAGDVYEDDDTCGAAKTVATDGTVQTHTFHDQGDNDWVKFDALAGKTYVVQVDNVGAGVDAVISLYDVCDDSPLAYGGNAFGPTVRMEWDCTADGEYYLRLQNDSSVYGEDTYDLSLTVDVEAPSAPRSVRAAPANEGLVVQWRRSPER